MTTPSEWLRQAIAPALSNILLLQRAAERGGFDPHLLRRELDAALTKLRLDPVARDLGFTPEHIQRVRVALITAADEFTQRPGSRCDYSRPPPAGEVPLLQQKYFQNRIDLGNRFFDELKAVLDKHSPSPVEHAALEVFALCIALGVRGMYEAFDLDGYEAIRTRLVAKLRTNLALPEGPPQLPPAPWPARPRSTPLLLAVAASIVLFVTTLYLQYRAETARSADILHDQLRQRLAPHTAESSP
ncbi:MAG TPA: DotU family type IV/VI secretion system protein [Nannocystaceae bacterium]|nr:DotU family type IV/VI secretion system protein [Nannocystaceae bacterium]